jgi:hypothetical protein
MAVKRPRTAVNLLDQVGDTIAQFLQQQMDALTSDDTPLSEEAVPAAIHLIEAIQPLSGRRCQEGRRMHRGGGVAVRVTFGEPSSPSVCG